MGHMHVEDGVSHLISVENGYIEDSISLLRTTCESMGHDTSEYSFDTGNHAPRSCHFIRHLRDFATHLPSQKIMRHGICRP